MPLLRAHTFSGQRLTLFTEHEGHRLPSFSSRLVTWTWMMGPHPQGRPTGRGQGQAREAADFRSFYEV